MNNAIAGCNDLANSPYNLLNAVAQTRCSPGAPSAPATDEGGKPLAILDQVLGSLPLLGNGGAQNSQNGGGPLDGLLGDVTNILNINGSAPVAIGSTINNSQVSGRGGQGGSDGAPQCPPQRHCRGDKPAHGGPSPELPPAPCCGGGPGGPGDPGGPGWPGGDEGRGSSGPGCGCHEGSNELADQFREHAMEDGKLSYFESKALDLLEGLKGSAAESELLSQFIDGAFGDSKFGYNEFKGLEGLSKVPGDNDDAAEFLDDVLADGRLSPRERMDLQDLLDYHGSSGSADALSSFGSVLGHRNGLS